MIDTTGMDTSSVLNVAWDFALKHDISDIVLATTKGDTALKAATIMGDGRNVLAVTHSSGFVKENHQELDIDIRREIEKRGIRVLTSVMPFHCWFDHYRKRSGAIMPTTVIADTLRLFGQGTKVCVEIMMMGIDAGLLSEGCPILSVAGTGRGADTVLLIRGFSSRRFFDLRIMDVIAKPRDW